MVHERMRMTSLASCMGCRLGVLHQPFNQLPVSFGQATVEPAPLAKSENGGVSNRARSQLMENSHPVCPILAPVVPSST
jgi:hypothetical protein